MSAPNLKTPESDNDLILSFSVPGRIHSLKNRRMIVNNVPVKTKELKQDIDKVRQCAYEKFNGHMYTGYFSIEVIAYYKNKRWQDVDAPVTTILDALEGIVYENDTKCIKILTEKRLSNTGVEYTTIKITKKEL